MGRLNDGSHLPVKPVTVSRLDALRILPFDVGRSRKNNGSHHAKLDAIAALVPHNGLGTRKTPTETKPFWNPLRDQRFYQKSDYDRVSQSVIPSSVRSPSTDIRNAAGSASGPTEHLLVSGHYP